MSLLRDGNAMQGGLLGGTVVLCNDLPKAFSLQRRHFQLKRRRLPRAVRACKRACTPCRTTVDLGQVGQLSKGVPVSKRDIDHSVVYKRGECVRDGGFLPATLTGRGDEDTAHLARKCRPAPERAGGVPECLPLHRKVAVASGNAKQKGVKVDEVVWEKYRVVGARRCPDQLQNIVREGFLDLVDHGTPSGLADTSLDGFCEFGDVSVEGVDNDGHSRS